MRRTLSRLALCVAASLAIGVAPAHAAKKPIKWSEFKQNRVEEAMPNIGDRMAFPKLLPTIVAEARDKYEEWQEAWSNHLRYREVAAASEAVETSGTLEASGYSSSTGPFAIPTYIVMCESGGNYLAENDYSTASGAYQIIDGTWAGYGGYSHASHAPPAVQDAKAAELWAGGAGASHWAACL